MSPSQTQRLRARTVFISDVHLGYAGCQARYLLDFLSHLEVDTVVLVGDIVDLLSLRKVSYWPASHQSALQALFRLAKTGTRVVYVPGNHDEAAREFCGALLGAVEVHREFLHETADGRRFLVLHGDEFDAEVEFSAWRKVLGSTLYDVLLEIGHLIHAVRRRLGRPYWSLATWIKERCPDAVTYIGRFEAAAAQVARERGLDGVICGHIHRPELRSVDGVLYCNDGDWVEHCTALMEDDRGHLSLLRWAGAAEALTPRPAQLATALERAA